MLRFFREKVEIRVVGDQWGSPTYAPDLAEAILGIVMMNSEAYGIYHFTNEGNITWYDFAREIYDLAVEKKFTNKKISILQINTEDYPAKAQRPRNAYLSKDIFKNTFQRNIRPWQRGLHDFLEEMREN